MNERIKELALQANEEFIDQYSGAKYFVFNKEKFAELLIKECSKINDQFIGRRIGEIDLDIVYKEHFGVK